ncbi:MAG: 50S ribosomal protein L4 [Firmicutes bacterium HGW-Firmicutes-13]|nr:MAG: 50S ribosomal protein L4 [Firmicutes bacterium HGW-Firmicutes-13]
MPKLALYDTEGNQVGEVDLNPEIFDVKVNEALMHSVVLMQLANRRKGTSFTKTRGEVRGGGRKPWRQKGTGRSRHGTIRSPLWVGGGTTFGPRPRDFGYTMPKKARKYAIKSALTSKVKAGAIKVLEKLTMEQPKTKDMAKILANLKTGKKVLVVTGDQDNNVVKSARNIPGVKTLPAYQLNVYDILNCENLILTEEAVHRAEEVFTG